MPANYSLHKVGPCTVNVIYNTREKQRLTEFVRLPIGGDKRVWPTRDEPSDKVRTYLEENGYEIQEPLHSDPALNSPQDRTTECNQCNIPMLERDAERGGSTPTSPQWNVLFECPDCSSQKQVTRRRGG